MGQPCCKECPKGQLPSERAKVKCCAVCCANERQPFGSNPNVVVVEEEEKAYKPSLVIEEVLEARDMEVSDPDRQSSSTPATGSRPE
eukprot:994142-Amphidinium_carterae.4